ncbi:NAD(P)/FAD-dependent oxidoreductase, partial [Streptomyces virginiae]
AVRSDRGVHPDYVSDVFSAFYPLAAASPVLARLKSRTGSTRAASRAPRGRRTRWTSSPPKTAATRHAATAAAVRTSPSPHWRP